MTFHAAFIVDDALLLDVLCRALRAEGFAVTGVRPEELEHLFLPDSREIPVLHPPDAFFIDLDPDEAAGLEIVRSLRRRGKPRMVAISGRSDALRNALESRMFHAVLAKPFDLDELIRCVA